MNEPIVSLREEMRDVHLIASQNAHVEPRIVHLLRRRGHLIIKNKFQEKQKDNYLGNFKMNCL